MGKSGIDFTQNSSGQLIFNVTGELPPESYGYTNPNESTSLSSSKAWMTCERDNDECFLYRFSGSDAGGLMLKDYTNAKLKRFLFDQGLLKPPSLKKDLVEK